MHTNELDYLKEVKFCGRCSLYKNKKCTLPAAINNIACDRYKETKVMYGKIM